MAKSFREFLAEQKKQPGANQLKEKVNIATAGTTFYLNHIKEKGLGQQYIKSNEISQAAVKLTDDFRNDIEMLDGSDYKGFVGFVRKFESALNELPKNRNLSPEDREYVESAIKDPLSQIATIRGPVLRLAYGLEDFKKQFKPLKLADRLLGDVPIIGDMIKSKIEDIEAGEEAVIRAGREAAKAKARDFRKSLGIDDDDMGEDFAQADDVVGPSSAGTAAEFEQQLTDERLEDRGRSDFMSTGAKQNRTEEQRKEANVEREQTQNIFEAIMANTAETNEILKELTEAYKDENEGMGEILDTLGAGGLAIGGGAAGAGTLLAGKKLLGKKTKIPPSGVKKPETPKGNKLKKNIKKVAQVAKTGAKGLAAKVPWLLPIIGAYDVISGAAGAEEILEAAPDEEVSFFDRLGAGIGKFVETSTFGLVDAKSAAEFLGAKAEKKVDSTAEVATEAAETTLASTYTMDADVVNLRANQIRLGTFDNMMEKMNNDLNDMASFFNNQIVNNNSNATTILPPVSSNNNDQSVIVDRNNLYK